jgi:hypothetical protein
MILLRAMRVYLYSHFACHFEALPMFGLFKSSPTKKLQKEHDALVAKAFQAQRDGNIRLYSTLTAEAEQVRSQLESAKSGERG